MSTEPKPKYFTILSRLRDREDAKWISQPSFSHMRKSFADGAWAMLKAHGGGILEYRLVDACDRERVIDSHKSSPMRVS